MTRGGRQAGGSRGTPSGRGLSVIFKGSDRCNAGCAFCSVGKAGARIVDAADVEILGAQIELLVAARGVERLGFTFHGGEPTLLGAALVDRICRRIARGPVPVEFSMQSNLLDVDDAMIGVLREHGVKLGTSVDPIGGLRTDADGRDAFPRWLAGYLKVAAALRAPGAIFVVTRSALGQEARLYRIAEALGRATGQRAGLQLNPVYAQGKAADDGAVHVTPEQFGGFLVEMWRRWERAGRSVTLSPIDQLAQAFPRSKERALQLPCAFAGRCSSTHVGIDFDLNVAGCGRRLDSRAFLGNLRDAGLVEILAGSDEQRRIAGRSEALRETACAGCRFFPICRGGCPDDAELGTGSLEDRFNWCESFRTLFAAMEAAPAPIPVPAAPARPGPAPEASRSAAPPPRIELFAAADPAAMPADPEGSPARREPWLLPTEDGRALRFDGALESLVDRRGGRAWLWIHNRHARSLAMWEDLVRRRDVVVGLFEAPDLARALNQLNAVEAAIAIDVPVVVAADGGAEALAAAVTRFLGDPLWKAQIFPFSWMLLAAVSGKPRPLTSRYGHPPGRIDVAVGPVGDDPAAAALRAGLEESGASLAAWLAARRPCLECELLPICGACMARGDGSSCHPTALEIARQLARAGAEIASTIGPRAPG